VLPAVRGRHPREVAALLDVCLRDESEALVSWELVDYLVTLLASEEQGGRRRVVCDPCAVTPRLERLCAAAEAELGSASAELAELLRRAGAELERTEPTKPIVEQMRSLKRGALRKLLVPAVLRAIVDYNLAIWNRLAELNDADRILEDVEFADLELPSPAPAEAPEADEESEPGPSVFESEELGRIVLAVQERITTAEPSPPADDADEIAARLELSGLTPFEETAFRTPEEDPTRGLVRLAVSVGLLLRELPAIAESLSSLGIDEARLRTEWRSEIENGLREAMQASLSSDRYDDARKLAELRTRFFRAAEAAPGTAAHGLPLRTLEVGDLYGEAERQAHPPRRKAASRRVQLRWRETALVVVLLVVALGSMVLVYRGGDVGNVKIYSQAEAAAVSPYLSSGYRDGWGVGSRFFGSVNDDWNKLPSSRQIEVGLELARALKQEGVAEVMLFDSRRALKLHWVKGRLQYPVAPTRARRRR
jgi:hypothetical protein